MQMQTAIDVRGYYNYAFLRKKLNEISSIIADILPKDKAKRKDYLLSYDFILDCTKTYERFTFDDVTVLTFLLATYKENDGFYDLKVFREDEAFVAFYILALHYYRKRDAEIMFDVLHEYVGNADKQFSFEKYPMIWDLVNRYAIITRNYAVLLASAEAGSRAMPKNVAMGVSYTEGVCMWANDVFYKTEHVDPKTFPIEINEKGAKDFQKDTLINALSYSVKAILNNPSYAKYYFQFAELLFYVRVLFTDKSLTVDGGAVNEYNKKQFNQIVKSLKSVKSCENVTCDWAGVTDSEPSAIRIYILRFVDIALEYATTEDEKTRYKRFYEMTENYFEKKSASINLRKNKIINSKKFDDCKNLVKCQERGEYVLISYSRADYKSVFCDILEYQEAGIGVVFDDKLDEMSSAPDSKWYESFQGLMKKAKALICFVSENYIQSEAVMRELDMATKAGITIIPVDLTGGKQISAVIASVFRAGKVLPSKHIKLLTTVFDDDQLMYCKGRNADTVTHIPKIEKVLFAKCKEVFSKVTAECGAKANSRDGISYRPQEDFFVCDKNNGIYVVADGITRQEGYTDEKSSASQYTKTFCENLHGAIVSNMKENVADPYIMLNRSFSEAVNMTKNALEQDKNYAKVCESAKTLAKEKGVYFENPGCVFVVGVVYNGTLYYGHVGDCAILMYRKGQVLALTESQTEYAFKVANVEGDRALLYDKYVNKPSNEHGYGVVNGDAGVYAFFKVSSIELLDGDNVFLASDGISEFLRRNALSVQGMKTVDEIFEKQNAERDGAFDDRTLIRINVGKTDFAE